MILKVLALEKCMARLAYLIVLGSGRLNFLGYLVIKIKSFVESKILKFKSL